MNPCDGRRRLGQRKARFTPRHITETKLELGLDCTEAAFGHRPGEPVAAELRIEWRPDALDLPAGNPAAMERHSCGLNSMAGIESCNAILWPLGAASMAQSIDVPMASNSPGKTSRKATATLSCAATFKTLSTAIAVASSIAHRW